MPDKGHENFDLCVDRAGEGYRVRVAAGPVGEAAATVAWDLTDEQVDSFFYKVGRPRRRTRRAGNPYLDEAKRFGGRLHDAVFQGDVLANLDRSLAVTADRGVGLRIRLRLAVAPELGDLPWEFLFSRTRNQFLSLSPHTPVVRYLDLPEPIKPLPVAPPLKLLVVIAGPSDHPRLDVEREWQHLREALDPLVERRLVEVDRLEAARPGALTRRLSRDAVHVLHFVGHGDFNEEAQCGELVFEDERGKGRHVRADQIATLLNSHRSLRLVVLNSCEGARASRTDPFAGTAQALVQQGVPAVIAMQFEITDEAAIALAARFYDSVAVGRPIDAGLADARLAVYAKGDGVEWATPVLYLRAPDGRIFDVEKTPAVEARLASAEPGRAARARLGGTRRPPPTGRPRSRGRSTRRVRGPRPPPGRARNRPGQRKRRSGGGRARRPGSAPSGRTPRG